MREETITPWVAIAHEIKNPLSLALAHVGLIRQAEASVSVYESCERIAYALEEIHGLVQDMLFAVHTETTAMPFDLYEMLIDLVADYHAALPHKEISLTTQHEGISLVGVEPYIRMIFSNLLKNATETTANQIYIHIDASDDLISVAVRDNGQGVKPRGNGLGLSICRWALTRYGGWMDVSASDAGCTAMVFFPK